MRKRLFIAVDIDDTTREQIRRISIDVRALVEAVTKASWVRPERMHITLHFFDGADDRLEGRLRAALADPIPETAFDLSFGRLGYFPERGSPRVLWLGVRDGLEPLCRIQKALGEHVQLPPDREGAFTPHLTLARFRDRVSRTKLTKIAGIPAVAGPSRIDRVTLYESRLTPAGPTYLPLAEARLRSAAEA